MISREDQLRIINRPNHSTIAHFPDGTRITSYFVRDQLSINDSETGRYFEKCFKFIKISLIFYLKNSIIFTF